MQVDGCTLLLGKIKWKAGEKIALNISNGSIDSKTSASYRTPLFFNKFKSKTFCKGYKFKSKNIL